MNSDVPLAFCMSGGVDTNVLISIAKKIFDYDVHGFTAVDMDDRYNELDLVNESVKKLGVRHTMIEVNSKDFLFDLKIL